ncbi:MAG: bifunctional methylenetetrahydrofolate dehydrogenase/methenyltetrahydrofolate cyclohydrolase FolD [Candidatus Competibacteraceae bacterium]|nr:bifunctional methylenetetrahydrofolate dehydrogenase/methenyltetrahydrofolate cyclohydrolase FolD [Candidatus Competibacteraceae bacterium]
MAMATLIDGKHFAARLRAGIALRIAELKREHELTPGLAVVLVGDDPASQIYVRNKGLQAREAGMNSYDHRLPATATQAELLARIAQLNHDSTVHGILVQLPLPSRIDQEAVVEAIAVAKDVDGFHPFNAGLLAVGGAGLVPCTPVGCLMLLKQHLGSLAGQRAVVLGRSNIVGKPMAALLLREHCTVTIAHSRTRDLAEECRRADILVAAVGKPKMVEGDWLKPGATVIDVGINRIPTADGNSRLVGDVDFESAVKVAGAITPVPGGVGPMTIACLLLNTLTAACRQRGIPVPEIEPVRD